MPVFLVLMPWTMRMCLRQLPLRLKTMEQTWHLVAPICIGMWWYRELRCWKHFPQMSHLWTNGFPSSLKVVRKLYGCGSKVDVWPLDTPKKPGHNCIVQTIFNIYGTLPKTSVQTHTNRQYKLPSMSSQHTANPFSVCQESAIATRQLHITPTIVINYMIIHTPASVVLWTLTVRQSQKKSSYIHTRSACMPMPWIWRKCRFMFPIRLRTSEQIWHVVSPMCMAICNWQDFLWRKSLLQTPQRKAGLAATDDTLLHQLPTTGGNNHNLVAPIHPTTIPLP